RSRFSRASAIEFDAALADVATAVRDFIESPARSLDLPLDLRGTEFQRSVWSALQAVGAGETTSYREIAQKIGRPKAVRAVGQAIAANPLAVIVPCHRAIRSDGSLSGYRWGVERKRALLEREGGAVE